MRLPDGGVSGEAPDPQLSSGGEESAEELYEDAPCGQLSTTPDGTIVRVNRTFLAATGHRAEDLVGRKRIADLLAPGGRIFYETHFAPLLRMQGMAREIAVEFVRADGSRLPALINATLREASGGRPAVVRVAVFEAQDRRQYERELLRARHRAEESELRARLLAETLQASLIPPSPPEIPGLDVGAVYRPAGDGDEVGGDFYDVFELAGGAWAVVVGDVRGKGVEAANVTALARYTIRAAAMQTTRPRQVLGTLNRALLRQETERFCTALFLRALEENGSFRVTLASGGHPLPMHLTPRKPTRVVGVPGTLLGVFAVPELQDVSLHLRGGEVLALFTDGVTEGRREGELFGEARLRATLQAHSDDDATAIADAVVREVVDYQGGTPRDDIAVVVLKVPPVREITERRLAEAGAGAADPPL